jgi:tetratricopeptide (TPR) repeat protein
MAFLLGFIGPGLQADGKEQWVEVKSPHFVAVSDAGESEARKALRQFEEIREVFRKVFPGIRVDAGRPLSILVLRDEASMKRFLSARFEGKDSVRPSGWFAHSQDEDYALLRLDAGLDVGHPYSVLYHEYTHGIINTNFPHLPVWLNEGLAEFYGATEIQKDKVLIGGIQPTRLLHLRQSAFLPADIFFAVDHDSPHYREGQKATQFYAQSWALVHYLLMDPRAQKEGLFRKLLEALGRGVDSTAAARSTFGDLQEFTNSLRTYAKQHAFQYWTFEVATRLSDKDFVSRHLDRAEALTIRAEYLLRSGRQAEARPLLEEALGLDPGLARTYAALGQLDLLGNDPKQARARLLEAQRLDGRDFRTAYYLGVAALRSRASDDLERAEARLHLERACALNPSFAPAHSMLALACVGFP